MSLMICPEKQKGHCKSTETVHCDAHEQRESCFNSNAKEHIGCPKCVNVIAGKMPEYTLHSQVAMLERALTDVTKERDARYTLDEMTKAIDITSWDMVNGDKLTAKDIIDKIDAAREGKR